MSNLYNPDMVINNVNTKTHTYDPVLNNYVDNNRPKPQSGQFIDVAYDTDLVGQMQYGLYSRVSELLTREDSPYSYVDLFFTSVHDYNRFCDIALHRGFRPNESDFPNGSSWGLVDIKEQSGHDLVHALALTASPFIGHSNGREFHVLRLTLNNNVPVNGSYKYANNNTAYYTGGDYAALFKFIDVISSGDDEQDTPEDYVRITPENSKVIADNLINESNGSLALIETDRNEFDDAVVSIVGRLPNPDATGTVKRDFIDRSENPSSKFDTTIYSINRFASFGRTYSILNKNHYHAVDEDPVQPPHQAPTPIEGTLESV